VILTGRGGDVEVRSAQWPGFSFGANPLTVPPAGWHGATDREAVAGVPAASLAVRIASEQVAGMCPGVFRGDGLDRVEVNRSWQAMFFDGQPNQTDPWDSVWQQTEASLTAENNAYWWLTIDAGRVASVQVVDPSLVTPKWNGSQKVYDVIQRTGTDTVGADKVLHFRGPGAPGSVAAPNPIDVFVDSFDAAINRAGYEAEFYDRGMGQAIAVTFPQGVQSKDAKAFQDALLAAHGGKGNQHKPRIFGNGASIQTIGISPRDAQFIEAMQFSVEEVARIYNVTVTLLGGTPNRGSGMPLSPEHEMTRWLRFGLAPRLRRIAAAINHHPAFFGAGSRDSFDWETSDVLKGDVETEELIAHNRILDGRGTVNEWRATKGLPPVPWGDEPQATPVGGAPNPSMKTPSGGGTEPATEPAAELDT
jgi:HK97 family phage portal protein